MERMFAELKVISELSCGGQNSRCMGDDTACPGRHFSLADSVRGDSFCGGTLSTVTPAKARQFLSCINTEIFPREIVPGRNILM